MIIQLFLGLSLVVTLVVAAKLYSMFRIFTKPSIQQNFSPEDLPSVSLCIPARNETHAMTDCLQRALASTYPKLEIIVLDDGSRDDTVLLIKSFAHAGVRFIEGSPLPDGWLGKNYALRGLAAQASGKLLLFADVDTRMKPNTITQLVAYMQQQNVDMVSVLPIRFDGYRASVLFTTLRQFWSILFHRNDRPAVASNAWLVKRSVIVDEMAKFEPVRQQVRPDAAVARQLMARAAYRFLISTPALGISYEKKWQSQVETSERLAFPLLGGRWALTLLAIAALTGSLLPYGIVIGALAVGDAVTALFALVTIAAMIGTYGYYLSQIWARGWALGMWLQPIIVLQEIGLILLSAIKYTRGTVTWKGRPVRTAQSAFKS